MVEAPTPPYCLLTGTVSDPAYPRGVPLVVSAVRAGGRTVSAALPDGTTATVTPATTVQVAPGQPVALRLVAPGTGVSGGRWAYRLIVLAPGRTVLDRTVVLAQGGVLTLAALADAPGTTADTLRMVRAGLGWALEAEPAPTPSPGGDVDALRSELTALAATVTTLRENADAARTRLPLFIGTGAPDSTPRTLVVPDADPAYASRLGYGAPDGTVSDVLYVDASTTPPTWWKGHHGGTWTVVPTGGGGAPSADVEALRSDVTRLTDRVTTTEQAATRAQEAAAEATRKATTADTTAEQATQKATQAAQEAQEAARTARTVQESTTTLNAAVQAAQDALKQVRQDTATATTKAAAAQEAATQATTAAQEAATKADTATQAATQATTTADTTATSLRTVADHVDRIRTTVDHSYQKVVVIGPTAEVPPGTTTGTLVIRRTK